MRNEKRSDEEREEKEKIEHRGRTELKITEEMT
jgi:hypothetical protein